MKGLGQKKKTRTQLSVSQGSNILFLREVNLSDSQLLLLLWSSGQTDMGAGTNIYKMHYSTNHHTIIAYNHNLKLYSCLT